MRRSALVMALAIGALLVTGAAAFNRRMGEDEGVAAVMWRRNLQQADQSTDNDTSIAFALLNATGLQSSITNSTLLLPNDAAFQSLAGALSSMSLDLGNFTTLLQQGDNENLAQNFTDIFNNNSTLSNMVTTILQLHVIPNEMLYKDNITQLISSSGGEVSVPTAGGTNITLSSPDNTTINVSGPGNFAPAQVTDADMVQDSNIIHTINGVLLPDLTTLGGGSSGGDMSPPSDSDMSPPSGSDMTPPSGGDMAPPDGGDMMSPPSGGDGGMSPPSVPPGSGGIIPPPSEGTPPTSGP